MGHQKGWGGENFAAYCMSNGTNIVLLCHILKYNFDVYKHIGIYTYVYIHTCVCVCVYAFVYMCVHTHTHILFTFTHTHTQTHAQL